MNTDFGAQRVGLATKQPAVPESRGSPGLGSEKAI